MIKLTYIAKRKFSRDQYKTETFYNKKEFYKFCVSRPTEDCLDYFFTIFGSYGFLKEYNNFLYDSRYPNDIKFKKREYFLRRARTYYKFHDISSSCMKYTRKRLKDAERDVKQATDNLNKFEKFLND